jgi:hypothetical protein
MFWKVYKLSRQTQAPFGGSAVVGSFMAPVEGVAEEARTRGFAAPAFAGCAFVVGLATLSYRAGRGLSSDQRAARCGFPQVMCGVTGNSRNRAGERVFRGVDRWMAGNYHRERLRALGLVGNRLHDARHHWAVRMARAGAPFELIARQLGHKDVAMVAKVYGRFKPDAEERDRWEKIAAARDAEKWPSRGAAEGAGPEKQLEVESGSNWEESSRGGTRTRDPGIMSAVL